QIEREVLDRLEALPGILLQAPSDDAIQLPRHGRGKRSGAVLEDRDSRLDGRLPRESAAPTKRFVEDRSEGEDVRARVCLLTPDLLRRHVSDGPDRCSGLRLDSGRR